MKLTPLPETTRLLYSELLEQSIHAAAETAAQPLPPGSMIEKKVRGRTYWYLQTSVGGLKKQHYLGPDSAALRSWIANARDTREERASDRASRDRLAGMLASGGASTLPASLLRVFELLDGAHVFHWGGVLVGTHAFGTYGNMLGVSWSSAALRTQDIDIAQDSVVGVGLRADAAPVDLPEILKTSGLGFFPIPAMDARKPSTSFSVRGKELRIDFLTPMHGPERSEPVYLKGLGVAAQPLRLLDFLIAEPVQAMVLGRRRAILVNVPQPARFALHKLWTSTRRSAAFHSKAQKDLAQAAALIDVLLEERPGDLEEAAMAVAAQPKVLRNMAEAARKLGTVELEPEKIAAVESLLQSLPN